SASGRDWRCCRRTASLPRSHRFVSTMPERYSYSAQVHTASMCSSTWPWMTTRSRNDETAATQNLEAGSPVGAGERPDGPDDQFERDEPDARIRPSRRTNAAGVRIDVRHRGVQGDPARRNVSGK